MKECQTMTTMKRWARWFGVVGLGVMLSGCVEAPPQQPQEKHQQRTVPLLLEQAHEAYAQGKWKQTALLVKQVLQQHSSNPVIRKNALLLIARAHEQKPVIATDWSLPKGVKLLEFMTRRGIFLSQTIYHSALRFRTVERDTLKQVKLTHASGRVVLNKVKSVGTLHSSFQKDGNNYLHDFYTADERAPLPLGLYHVELETKAGQNVKGWFLVDTKAYSTSSPQIGLPSKLRPQDLSDQLRFPSFRSPEFRAGERRTFYSRIVRLSKGKNSVAWELWTAKFKPEQWRVKRHLKPGSYRLYAGYREVRKLGPIYLSRISYRLKRFSIEGHVSSR